MLQYAIYVIIKLYFTYLFGASQFLITNILSVKHNNCSRLLLFLTGSNKSMLFVARMNTQRHLVEAENYLNLQEF